MTKSKIKKGSFAELYLKDELREKFNIFRELRVDSNCNILDLDNNVAYKRGKPTIIEVPVGENIPEEEIEKARLAMLEMKPWPHGYLVVGTNTNKGYRINTFEFHTLKEIIST